MIDQAIKLNLKKLNEVTQIYKTITDVKVIDINLQLFYFFWNSDNRNYDQIRISDSERKYLQKNYSTNVAIPIKEEDLVCLNIGSIIKETNSPSQGGKFESEVKLILIKWNERKYVKRSNSQTYTNANNLIEYSIIIIISLFI